MPQGWLRSPPMNHEDGMNEKYRTNGKKANEKRKKDEWRSRSEIHNFPDKTFRTFYM
jgi:hypothetical protein